MTKVLVTGANGFVGKNLVVALRQHDDLEITAIDIESSFEALERALTETDIIFHLAGVNRPQTEAEFGLVNAGLTQTIGERLTTLGRSCKVVLASSVQAEQANPYGLSKLQAEHALRRYAELTSGVAVVYRLKNLFGKWCRPNYNSVTATFCHNLAHDLPIEISDVNRVISLSYIDDVVDAFLSELGRKREGFSYAEEVVSTEITLGELAELIRSFRAQRTTLLLPDFSKPFVRSLYATYLSYLEPEDIGYSLTIRSDPRGSLAEFVKQDPFGQLFVSRTKPGITRGNHRHSTKTEKFLVVEGNAVIRLRRVGDETVHSFAVRGDEYRVVDIPPGYTHSIENVGMGDLVTLFWASEIFDPAHPDTVGDPVLHEVKR